MAGETAQWFCQTILPAALNPQVQSPTPPLATAEQGSGACVRVCARMRACMCVCVCGGETRTKTKGKLEQLGSRLISRASSSVGLICPRSLIGSQALCVPHDVSHVKASLFSFLSLSFGSLSGALLNCGYWQCRGSNLGPFARKSSVLSPGPPAPLMTPLQMTRHQHHP